MEIYDINLDNVSSKYELFNLFSKALFLGDNKIEKWSAFYDLMRSRALHSDIKININNKSLKLCNEEYNNYLDTMADLEEEFPNKFIIRYSDGSTLN